MCTVLLPPGFTSIAVKKYIISYRIVSYIVSYHIISYNISYHIYRIISHIISYIISHHISYHIIYHIISHHISHHITSYLIVSYITYHITSYYINEGQALSKNGEIWVYQGRCLWRETFSRMWCWKQHALTKRRWLSDDMASHSTRRLCKLMKWVITWQHCNKVRVVCLHLHTITINSTSSCSSQVYRK
jgi:hypothetical protein